MSTTTVVETINLNFSVKSIFAVIVRALLFLTRGQLVSHERKDNKTTVKTISEGSVKYQILSGAGIYYIGPFSEIVNTQAFKGTTFSVIEENVPKEIRLDSKNEVFKCGSSYPTLVKNRKIHVIVTDYAKFDENFGGEDNGDAFISEAEGRIEQACKIRERKVKDKRIPTPDEVEEVFKTEALKNSGYKKGPVWFNKTKLGFDWGVTVSGDIDIEQNAQEKIEDIMVKKEELDHEAKLEAEKLTGIADGLSGKISKEAIERILENESFPKNTELEIKKGGKK